MSKLANVTVGNSSLDDPPNTVEPDGSEAIPDSSKSLAVIALSKGSPR